MDKTIELDCAPGQVRPDALLVGVLAGTSLAPREPVSKFFGNWVFDYSDVADGLWASIKPTLKERITALYHQGRIRYGSW
jgi:hypothetical protein